ncbi:MAG: FkbM family methyltransferase [Maricaulaceae bacterium]
MFSGYDISFDYFLYAHLQKKRHGHARPLEWETSSLQNRGDLILCDFRSRKSIDEIFRTLYGKLPVLHGVKDDAARHAVIKRARGGRDQPAYTLSGKGLSAPIDRRRPLVAPQIVSKPPKEIGANNDRLVTLEGLFNRFKGERCYLIANGPSLKKTDLTPLKNEFTIGLNRINLNFENMGFEPTVLCCVNKNVLDQFSGEFDRSSSIKFLSSSAENALKNTWNTFFMEPLLKVGHFEKDLRQQVWCEGWTVTYCGLQAAYFLGFDEVVIVGLDHYFKQSGDPNQAVVAQGADQNHFHPEYFGKGVTWQYPDLERSEQHYRVALETFQADGRRILDATVGGHCTIFPKIAYDRCLKGDFGQAEANSPKVSIVIPFKDEEKFIRSAIESVLSQGVENIEILCVDDGSSDSSPRIVFGMGEIDPRIKLVPNSGAGVSAARNTGIRAARGEYIGFLDADDAFLPASLSARLAKLEENPSWDVVHGVTYTVDPENTPLGTSVGLPRDFSFGDMHGVPAHFNSILVRRATAGSALSFPVGMTNGEDWMALARLMRQGYVSHFVEEAGSTYRFHPQSTVLKDMDLHEEKLRPILDWVFSRDDSEIFAEEFREGLDREKLNEVIFRRKASLLFWHVIAGEEIAARRVARAMNDLGLWDVVSWSNLAPALRANAVRRLAVNLECLPSRDSAAIQRCLKIIDDLSDEFAVAPLRDLFEKVFRQEERENDDRKPPSSSSLDSSIRDLKVLSGYSRENHAHLDETQAVASALADRRGPEHVMLDVGAHCGTSAVHFEPFGWTIHCFEPDPANRQKLIKSFGRAPNITIDPRAVSERPATGVSFYSSEESTGISALHAFRDTHREAARVNVTTVAEIVAERKLKRIDFLKIDVEGHDFAVLKGVPWDKIAPDVIECEFEDAKTSPLGHTWRDICEYLVQKDYSVYVSEWHPIVRYGVRHDWRALWRYPCELADERAWGNLLAFRSDPGEARLRKILDSVLKVERRASATGLVSGSPSLKDAGREPAAAGSAMGRSPADKAPGVGSSSAAFSSRQGSLAAANGTGRQIQLTPQGWYQRFAASIRSQSLAVFRVGQAGAWLVRAAARRPAAAAAAILVALTLVLTPIVFAPAAPLLPFLWGAAGLMGLAAAALAAASLGNAMLARLVEGQARAQQELSADFEARLHDANVKNEAIERRLALLDDRLRTLADQEVPQLLPNMRREIVGPIEQLKVRLNAIDEEVRQRIDDEISKDLSDVRTEFAGTLSRLEQRLDAVDAIGSEDFARAVRDLEEDLASALEAVEKRTRSSQVQEHARLNEEFSKRIGDIEQRLRGALEQTSDSFQKALSEEKNAVERLDTAVEALGDELQGANVNSGGYQTFNRVLTQDHVNTLREKWQKRLGISMEARSLFYLAHRICELERRLHGRLATSVEDAVLRTLVASACPRKTLNVIEIGTLFGVGLAVIYDHAASRFSKVDLIAVDPLDGYYKKDLGDIITGEPVCERTFRSNMTAAGVPAKRLKLIKSMSATREAIAEAETQKYDVLILDGDHSFNGVKADYQNYLPMVRQGGFIIFDDYDSKDWPDIKDFVDSTVHHDPRVMHVGSSWRTSVFRAVTDSSEMSEDSTLADEEA